MFNSYENNQHVSKVNSNCQIQTDNDFIYSEVNCMDSYKIAINIKLKENDNGEEVYNLIDDIKNLIKEKHGSHLYQSVKDIEITRSSSSVIVNSWKEGIESGKKEGLTYQIPLNSHEDGHTEPFLVKEVKNTREGELRDSSFGN